MWTTEDYQAFRRAATTVRQEKPNGYAEAYAKAGLQIFAGQLPGDLQSQSLYILSNISHWRHPAAKEIRETLKRLGKLPVA